MEAVQSKTETEERSHERDLASYLDRLLRQDRSQPEQVPPPAIQECQAAVVSADRHDSPSHDDSAPTGRTADQASGPGAEQGTEISKIGVARRPKRAAQPKIRTRPRHSQGRSKGSRQIATTALIPVLAVTLLVLVRRPMKGPPAAAAETPADMPAVSATASEVEIDWEMPPLYEPIGHDPMRLAPSQVPNEEPIVTQLEARASLDVKGVLYSEDRPAAIIGTRVVHEGEQISGATVIKIERDSVEFEVNGQRWKQTVSIWADLPGRNTGQSAEDGVQDTEERL